MFRSKCKQRRLGQRAGRGPHAARSPLGVATGPSRWNVTVVRIQTDRWLSRQFPSSCGSSAMPTRDRRGRALTLTELVVVGAAIAVFAAVVGPSVSRPRMIAQRTDCLSNLQRIGAALQAYAAEDAREQAIPIHVNMVRSQCSAGPCLQNGYYLWRTANWFAWGGQSATQVFKTTSSNGYYLSDEPNVPPGSPSFVRRPEYAASRRPLNEYISPDPLAVFHCPADTGYPNDPLVDDAPSANAGRSCFETLGNSYRASLGSMTTLSGSGLSDSTGHFAFGPWGHRLSALPNASGLVLIGDPVWFNMLGTDDGQHPGPLDIPGWHGVSFAENILFCDGGARLTSLAALTHGLDRRPAPPDGLALDTPDVCNDYLEAPTWGPAWQLDCYPSPGAVIWGDWSSELMYYSDCWPWKDAQLNPVLCASFGGPALRPSPPRGSPLSASSISADSAPLHEANGSTRCLAR